MWFLNEDGEKLFRCGREDFSSAVRAAAACAVFRPDEEDEWVTDEERSCYNCRFRRWTADSFLCRGPAEQQAPHPAPAS